MTEADARAYLTSLRWPNGFTCPRIVSGRVCDLPGESMPSRPWLTRCPLAHQTSLTAGTLLHRTRAAPDVWVRAAVIVANDPTISGPRFGVAMGGLYLEHAADMLWRLRVGGPSWQERCEALMGPMVPRPAPMDKSQIGGMGAQARWGSK